jgi:hypothetical protein
MLTRANGNPSDHPRGSKDEALHQDCSCRVEIESLGWAGVRPWRRITSPIAVRFGGPPALVTQPDVVGPSPLPPLIGALLRVPWETVRQRMLSGLHDRGFTDLVAAHVDVWRYPGPENQRRNSRLKRA